MEDVKKVCKDINKLNPLCGTLLNLALKEMEEKGITPCLVETYRSQERQNYLYTLGRTVKGNKVTWTTNSIHTKKNACDIVPQRNGKAIWDSNDSDTKKLINIMIKFGFQAGINFSTSKDSPHFQIADVSTNGIFYSKTNTNKYITLMVQKALNEKLGIHLVEDGEWGDQCTAAVNTFRKKNKWTKNGKLGATALKRLLA